ncbi:hypothetical protein PSH54_20405 [Pseudoalteromonas sp. Angola-30]|uniref:hypothetical protein n=1 Tax=Pseudoalteromonas sp. Angola-30 TaxID=3025341 RepID=UPI0023591443|nr:hypothetical protein [Pseudoalteromonas sp. Angola-30]MDC9527841.1 hypothetical protein [Pseudoalteromonas sp. Angola-30]
MAAFAFLYLILIIYSVALRLSIRTQIKANESVGLIYKVQTATVVIISFASGTALSYLFAQTVTEWLVQYIPTIICVATLVVWQRVKEHNAT